MNTSGMTQVEINTKGRKKSLAHLLKAYKWIGDTYPAQAGGVSYDAYEELGELLIKYYDTDPDECG